MRRRERIELLTTIDCQRVCIDDLQDEVAFWRNAYHDALDVLYAVTARAEQGSELALRQSFLRDQIDAAFHDAAREALA